jgi:flagellar hook assembly protein FlgD
MEYSVVVSVPENVQNSSLAFNVMPNPVKDFARICFELKAPSQVRVYIFDINGQSIDILENGCFSSGSHELNWKACDYNGNKLPAGAYMVIMQVNGEYCTRKIIVR